ncbi:sulfate transporter CysZ [Catenovulum sediminis]|uniref:sulfate transporter CysZ n=1 Tax=Catenovulum sediminis TaxID=1740262 RepID=UPI00163DCD0B|nr:sulfate transporter CysZ [Catenovulum sediminis]
MTSGIKFFTDGFSLINQKGIRRFVYIPLLVNCILFGAAFYWLIGQTDKMLEFANSWLPDWLAWLNVLVTPLIVITFFVVFAFLFTTIANFIAAPFHGLLASKVEEKLNPKLAAKAPQEFKLLNEIGRTLKREWQKQLYFLPRALGFLLLFFILPIGGQILWFLFIAWTMALQYCDFAFDNHKVPFYKMRAVLRQNKLNCFGFGVITSLCSMIPLVNMIVMPIAVCGATKFWVEELAAQTYSEN